MCGDDVEDRITFMELLADRSLPMPQSEAQWHASRIFMDHLDRCIDSLYDTPI